MNMKPITLIFLFLLVSLSSFSIDNHHFYRASNLFTMINEPTFDPPGTLTFDWTLAGGGTSTGLMNPHNLNASCLTGCCIKKTNILNICGAYNMHLLGSNVPGLVAGNPLDNILIALAQLPANELFGYLAFQGSFSIAEANLFATHVLPCGFFLQGHVPIRDLDLDTYPCFTDCSPATSTQELPNRTTRAWVDFLNAFDSILARYGLSIAPFHKTGVGDTSILAGWSRYFDRTEILDFFDITFRLGILFPTGATRSFSSVFSLPLGYNGHFGFPVSFDLRFGIYEWLICGFHLGALPFADRTATIRVRTNAEQQGPIVLASAPVCIRQGTVWDLLLYTRALHCCTDLSVVLGYTYAQKNADTFTTSSACTRVLCPPDCDFSYGKWHMHTLHLLLEYDFSSWCQSLMPRAGLFFNGVVGGENVFKTNTFGGGGGFAIACCW